MSNYLLETNMLTKKYGGKTVVDKVNLHIKKGDIYGLIGPNGAGKTTIMKMIAGFATPNEGEVSLFTERDRTKRIGALIEEPGMIASFNAFDNLKLKALAMGVYDKQNILDILKLVGLANDKKKVGHYSLGMKQRLGIALALIGHPDFLILDEPINGLDPEGILEIRELIIKLNREQNITIMISSHILEELSKVATTFGIITNGKLIKELTEFELKNESEEKIEIVTPDTGLASSVLENEGIVDYTVVGVDKIHVYGNDKAIADINKLLVRNDVNVSEIHVIGSSLESFYLSCVNGGKEAC
ncbi:MAG: ATP-binding cassette domain-containing protein [Lachnospiraceae bacterium]|nr:ATP-binding cassette domain-containing protein [Lachnospiraceae bacterium]